ncbi:helix-turn-helix transcriptional regulator [Ferrovibrio sp.]|uniref:helix-turn-helix domain-containing protein n=1 Tax=Ferrovibrio sp. TaxID=1917215 RepID=UPI0025BA7D67|nr:helix-turn-helix transcriptional regulator [Ferrovibrio sp.]
MARNPVDVYVGSRLKMRRTYVGMSQERLGQYVGLTFQQIQKYEKGANRIGASRLYQFSHILGVAPAFFFDGIDGQPNLNPVPGLSEPPQNPIAPSPMPPDPLMSRENLELLRAFDAIRNPALRRRVLDLVRSMATEQNTGEQNAGEQSDSEEE